MELLGWDCVPYIPSCSSFLFPSLLWVCGFLLRCLLIRVDYSTPGFYFLRCDVANDLVETNRTIRELVRQKSKSQLPNAEWQICRQSKWATRRPHFSVDVRVYHHCLFGTRYDFLCANYTAFDQKTFICHFVSEVDCANSPKYFKRRNEALYKQATTTVPTTTTAATEQLPPTRRPQSTSRPGQARRRPYRPRRPEYDYYYDDDYEDNPEYYDDELPAHRSTTAAPPSSHAGNGRRRKHRRPVSAPSAALDQEDPQTEPDFKPRPSPSVYDRPRIPPKIRRPVPLSERDKYDYTTRKSPSGGASAVEEPTEDIHSRPKPQVRPAVHQDDDYYEDEYVQPARNPQSSFRVKNADPYPPSATDDTDIIRRPTMTGAGRPLRRNRPGGPSRRRPPDSSQYAPLPHEDEADEYDLPYDEPRRPVRPTNGRRKRPPQSSGRQEDYYRPTAQSTRQDPDYSQQRGGQSPRYGEEEDDEPVPAPRPAYISTAPGVSSTRHVYRKRIHQQPAAAIDEYAPSRSQASETTAYRRPAGQRKHAAPARQPATYFDEPSEETDYYDDELPEQNYKNRQAQSHRSTQVASGPFKQQVSPLLPPPSTKASTDVEDDEVILPQQRSGSGKRPFLPSRGGNPTLPRGLQPLGAKAPQQNSKASSSNDDSTKTKQSRVAQLTTPSNYHLQEEDDYEEEEEEEEHPRQRTAIHTGSSSDTSDTLTSMPASQSTYKSGGRIDSLSDSIEEELPRTVQSGNSEYNSKLKGDTQSRIPPSTAGNFRTKQATAADTGETDSRNRNFNNGKYKQNSQENIQENPLLRVPEASPSNPKTSPLLPNVQGESNTNRQQISQALKTPAIIREDDSSVPPSGVIKVTPPVAVYRTPVKTPIKPSVSPASRAPDLPARTNLADIDESEYDVTLNDALHPTLHPTRSGRGYLAGSASQSHITRAPYASLSLNVKDPGLVFVGTNTRDGHLAYLQQPGTMQYNTQQAGKRTPVTHYDDDATSHGNPSTHNEAELQYRRGIANHDSGHFLVIDDTLYNHERQRQIWTRQQRREPNVDYVTQY
ncbi:hypothetical protein Cfor_07469 [Coptotermes formosanus]|uniref:Chitin-binding type-2 domain-containing protein n=1 Tax=Coptotermes formosanus TaxID=36987 RepID=A0A6L2PHR5_COPFO|nr:hypothetical protein Cfor_07469 [Coptotermes formosanus]